MKAKIDWYKEVLELEPGSKVFFPLARLLAENGQLQDALSTLRLGLERHPEFIEARLYVIELLYKHGQIEQCEPQVGQLTRLFSKYPGFWEAWGACAAGTDKRQDFSLTLRFLAVLFQRPEVSLGDIFEKGLYTLADTQQELSPLPEAETKPSKEALRSAVVEAPYKMPVDTPVPTAASVAVVDVSSPVEQAAEERDDPGEPFTLRTKSMADVLAGQSDINGALEIYRELASRAESPEERQEIHERIAQLSSPQAQAVDAPFSTLPDVSPPGKQRMQHLLESLAERLEARALG
jgi:tetratricopeptide (TPR) repeat protein